MYRLRAAVLALAFGFLGGTLSAQTAAESAASMSNAGIAAQAKPPSSISAEDRGGSEIMFQTPRGSAAAVAAKPGASNTLISHPGPPVDEVNRKHFEQNAGKNAGKVLFRSLPSGAAVFVNHMLVGNTPLLMFLEPGKYEIEARGAREESGHRTLAVMANQTETMVIDLNQRYPSSFSLHW